MDVMSQVVDARNLFDAFTHVRKSDEEDGVIDDDLGPFMNDPARQLENLATLVQSEKLKPRPMTAFRISKPGGGSRLIAVAPLADQIVERVGRLLRRLERPRSVGPR